jgi:hypothetical protein
MRILRLVAVALLAAVLPAVGYAQTPVDTTAASARRDRAPNGGALTAPSTSSPGAVVAGYVRARRGAAVADSLTLRKENPVARTGVVHLEFGQRVNDLDVHGTYVRGSVNARGELVSLIENLVAPPPALVPSSIDARGALAAVLRRYYPGLDPGFPELRSEGHSTIFGRGTVFSSDPTVTRVAVPMTNGAMHTGFLVETWDLDNILRHTVVGPGGQILREQLRTNTDTYSIFRDHPGNSLQTVVSGPGAGNEQSPSGWVANSTTTGNNVDAYLDRDNNNAPDTNGRPESQTRDFVYTADLTLAPTTATNQMAAVTNLFYLGNVIHDELYRHGFTESAGNFQTDNFDKGGLGGDPLLAEAQDGGGTNNANFATPADGSRPRMQMFLWTYSTPSRDGDLDSDIVWHEYGHGLTWRMIGSMSTALSGAIGEGMSDTLSIYINRDDVVGEYSYNSPGGIRRYPYSNYPLTYGDVTGGSVHADGEIYAAAMWKLLELWIAAGRTQDELLDHIVDGMNYTPASPAYEDMRDGLLAAMPTQDEDCLVWRAFAQFGIGEGADGRESCFLGFCFGVSITESFVVPSACSGGGTNTAPTVSIASPANGMRAVQGSFVAFPGSASDAQDGDLSSALVWTSDRDGQIGSGASFTTSGLTVGTHRVTASVTDSGGLNGAAQVDLTIDAAAPIALSASPRKVKAQWRVDLTWSGATGTNVDVFRNATLITSTPNDGSYTDGSGLKTGKSYSYKVCNAGTTTCSNVVTVTLR